jgi:hypothetical protein
MADEALVMNHGDQPITLKLYAADGLTAQNGGTSFMAEGVLSPGGSHAISSWVVLPTNEVSLGPGEELTLAFTVAVPADTAPGQYVTGLVVEAKPDQASASSSGEDAQFAVQVIRRVGVAVVIDVPGPRLPGLEILDVGLEQQSEESAVFSLLLHNTGNILLQSSGILDILDTSGKKLSSLPLELDTLLPGDTAIFHVTLPVHLSDGDYLLNTGLIYAEGQSSRLDAVELCVRDSKPCNVGQEAESEESPSVEVLAPMELGSGLNEWLLENRLLLALVLGALIVVIVIFEFVILRNLRNR